MRKIVVIAGSPRRNGNSEKLADAFIKGAKEVGHQVEKVSVIDYEVKGCLGCNYCIQNEGECIQKDGMQTIYKKLYQADMVVFATPVYFFNMSAQIKAIIDRLFVAIAKPLPITACALLLTLAGKQGEDSAPTLATYQTIVDYIKWQDKGIIIADRIMEKEDILGHVALQEAETLGKSL